MKRKNIAGLIAVAAVIAVAMLAGCLEEEKASTVTVSTPTISATPAPTFSATPAPTFSATPAPTFVLTHKDAKFLIWLNETRYTLMSHNDLMTEAVVIKDMDTVKMRSETLSDYVEKMLDEIDQFEISSALEPVKEEFKLELENYGQIGYYFAMWTKTHDDRNIKTATEFLHKCSEHMSSGLELLRQKGLIEEKSHESSARDLPTSKPKSTIQASVKSWYSVTTFTGSNDKTTAPFTIRGDRWRVRYTVDGDYEWGAFYAHVYPVGETVMYVSSWDCDGGYCYDTQYIYEGADDYYFKIGAANLDSWKLEVEDYY